MPDKDYLPRADADFAVWMQNFTLKITTVYNTQFNISAANITAIQNDNAYVAYLITQYLEAFKTALQDRVAYKDLFLDGKIGATGGAIPSATIAVPAPPAATIQPGIKARLRLLVKQIKANSAYTDDIGQDLGIIAPRLSPLPQHFRPKCSALAKAGSQVVITWTKGRFDGVIIESERGSETVWTFLDRDMVSPFVDTRPPLVAGQPEIRRYRLFYLKGDERVGDPSDVLVVTTIP